MKTAEEMAFELADYFSWDEESEQVGEVIKVINEAIQTERDSTAKLRRREFSLWAMLQCGFKGSSKGDTGWVATKEGNDHHTKMMKAYDYIVGKIEE